MSVQYFFSFDKISRTENPINFKAKQNTHKKKVITGSNKAEKIITRF